MTPDDISERLLTFAAALGRIVDSLPDTRLGRHVAGQLVRSGTAPVPNYEEARAAESRGDFIHKLSICLKELRETTAWLRLIVRAKLLAESELSWAIQECGELSNIIGQSVVTAKQNAKRKTAAPRVAASP